MEDGGVQTGLEAAITERQETESKLVKAEVRIAQLEEAIKSGGGLLANTANKVAAVIRPGGGPPPPGPSATRDSSRSSTSSMNASESKYY